MSPARPAWRGPRRASAAPLEQQEVPTGPVKDVIVTGDDIDLADPDFDFDITGSVDEDEEDTVIKGSDPAAEKDPESSDETIMLDDDDGDDIMEGYDDDDATIRPD